jgi:putative DNA primase/helicase
MRWALDNRDALAEAEVYVPDLNSDRAADNWAPLLAIADRLGGAWPAKARQAAIKLTRVETDEADGVTLLGHIREVFAKRNGDKLTSKDLVSELMSEENWGWEEYARGKGLSPTTLARLLKVFGVKPRTVKFGGNISAKGYRLEWFADAFDRYLPPLAPPTSLRQNPDDDES